jgi:excinuclease ABC subunit A
MVLYILDEPTTGLHLADIHRLLECLRRLVDAGHSVLVIEHHVDVIKTADWVIDMGPEGGHAGGEVIVAGTPEDVAACAASHTGRFLAAVLAENKPESNDRASNGTASNGSRSAKRPARSEPVAVAV